MNAKKTCNIKLGMNEELKEKLDDIAGQLDIDISKLIRGLLWNQVEIILADLNSSKEINYVLILNHGKELLRKE
ncbi:hypothetical protein ES702_02309 [subsurface metagenome]